MHARAASGEGRHAAESVSTSYLMVLTCGTFGLQCVWALLLASGTPYLLSLGYSRSVTALVWLAGPLCGTFLQPCIGALSDQCATRWGKRKPFIVVGIIGAITSMMSLALLRVMANRMYFWFAFSFLAPHTVTNIARTLSIIWLSMLNVSLQPIQVGLRALIVDTCPSHQQSQGSTWTGRFTALGSITTYLLDNFIIERYPARSFEVLCIVTSLSLVLTTLPSLLLVKETAVLCDVPAVKISNLSRKLWRTFAHMSSAVKSICVVQFASWLGWFPFLYYSVTYVSSFDSRDSSAAGVKAYFLFAIVTFYFSVILPWIRPSTESMTRWQKSTGLSSTSYACFNLRGLWFFSQVLFAICMLCTFFASSTLAAMALIAVSGISWSLSLWVPLAMMSVEISSLRDLAQYGEPSEGTPWQDEQTGMLMSIYNVAISAPQILAGCLCSIIFWLLGQSGERNSLLWIMWLSGAASLVSAALIVRLKF